ncbi:uncharacterized protein LOC125658650 [Ostrea edulis]|uniref:uncharacterized protein LOC125658650 n=1 Tax=Ostrea edulis TaxID=37623 RepID=UPI0024AF7A29|nr:uncharacterized protein LOC125658650 [Ostrea edulis]
MSNHTRMACTLGRLYNVLILCYVSVCCIRPPFISEWIDMESISGNSPVTVSHPFNEIPARVDVQVKVIYNEQEYIFPGLGSIQRDNDVWTEYGGVAYTYNETSVMLFVPKGKTTGRVVYTGGSAYTGEFDGSFTSCQARIKVWRLSDWPKPDFIHNCNLTISKSEPLKLVSHTLRRLPDVVTVQLKLDDGYVADGQGVTPVTQDDTGTNHVCGVLFGISTTSITLWAPSKNRDYVICYADGWGNVERSYEFAEVVIRAWILSADDIILRQSFLYTWGDDVPEGLSGNCFLDPDNHIVFVEIKDATTTDGKVFYAAGTASLAHAGDPFGGVVYGYNQTDVLLWTPSVSNGYLVYVDGIWGDGTETLHINTVQISVTILSTNNSVQNTTSIDIEEFINDLTIAKKETNSYERSLKCADDTRPSSKAVGSVGIALLCTMFGLIFLADCQQLLKRFCKRTNKTSGISIVDKH